MKIRYEDLWLPKQIRRDQHIVTSRFRKMWFWGWIAASLVAAVVLALTVLSSQEWWPWETDSNLINTARLISIAVLALVALWWLGKSQDPTSLLNLQGRYGYWKYSRLIRRVCGQETPYTQARRQCFQLPKGKTENCVNCGAQTGTLIMSMFSRLLICADCKAEEMQAPGYAEAEKADSEAARQGTHDFSGLEPATARAFLNKRRLERMRAKSATP